MDYVETLKKQYIQTGKKGYTIYKVSMTTQSDLEKQGFENIGGYSHYYDQYIGDYNGEAKINQVKMRIEDPVHGFTTGLIFKEEIRFSKDIIFENKSMNVDEIEEAYMWFESFKIYNRYSENLPEELHELLYRDLIETGKYKTHDFRHSVFEIKQGENNG